MNTLQLAPYTVNTLNKPSLDLDYRTVNETVEEEQSGGRITRVLDDFVLSNIGPSPYYI